LRIVADASVLRRILTGYQMPVQQESAKIYS
jgi:hypothetical protein